jgi:hypothetical protein
MFSSWIISWAISGISNTIWSNKIGLKSLKTEKNYRLEVGSDPTDNSIIYAIETTREEKGIFLDAYCVYSNV